MITLIHHIRKSIFVFSFILAIGIYYFVKQNFLVETQQFNKLSEFFALTAITYLYFAVLASPLYTVFPKFPFRPVYIRARRALGVSAFFFAFLHGFVSFFGLLGGFAGLALLNNTYLIAIGLSFTALLILSTMAVTSFDYMVKRLGSNWKKLHRFVYLAALLITIHALMLGNHFTDLSGIIPKISFAALSVLLFFEAIRFDRFLAKTFGLTFNFGPTLLIVTGLFVWTQAFLKAPSSESSTSLSFHSQHVSLAKDANKAQQTTLPNLPGLTGDRSKRYTVSFEHVREVTAGIPTTLKFKVFDASNGSRVDLFSKPYEKPFHLIIVDSGLTYFNHIHPVQKNNEFIVETTFPKNDLYHLYTDFQPLRAIDQQIAVTLPVGDTRSNAQSSVDKSLTKVFDNYEVSLKTSAKLSATEMSLGKQKLTFIIKAAKTKKPITDLKPYLNSFGHLVMINQSSYDYLHVHPYNLTAPPAGSNGGPQVDFLPIGIYGSFKSGIYRIFAQFNHNGNIFVADFTVKVYE